MILDFLWRKRWFIRALIPSVIFYLKSLPISQAVKLPIILYKPRIINQKGKIIINGPIKFGMIKLGINTISILPNNGIVIENRGIIIFEGNTSIGNNSSVSLGEKGKLIFGSNFSATGGLRIVCYSNITFKENVLIGWDTLFMDTDLHATKNINGIKSKGYGPILIGENVWIGNGCKIYKNVSIPGKCIIGADTIVHKSLNCPPYSLIYNKREIAMETSNIYLDRFDDIIYYE